MWIWELAFTQGGDWAAILERAKAEGVRTLYLKSGDGSTYWSQFSPALVKYLHGAGLRICAWQYVYGSQPAAEARVGAEAVHAGADCVVIDAEASYQGRYLAAQTYLRDLRRAIGSSYPLALTSFPYVDYHPSFPYSVFLGPGGAQYNLPQMYWRAIGVSPQQVFAHTYAFNRPYARPIYPLGQIYGGPPPRQIRSFRTLARAYGARGVSWFDWQDAGRRQFAAISGSTPALAAGFVPYAALAQLASGARGDLVVWAQEHLVSAGQTLAISGLFGSAMLAAVESFQSAHRLPVTGLVDQATWTALLRYRPVRVRWTTRNGHLVGVAVHAHRALAGALSQPVPASASLPARGYEIPPALGAGR
jgi:hypothetical protein